MMVEGTVDVKGTVKVDTSDELKNLYEIARRAKDSDNSENAAKYYDMILVKDPGSWEAYFYSVYYAAKACDFDNTRKAADSIKNCIDSLLKLLIDGTSQDTERHDAVKEITEKTIEIAQSFFRTTQKHYSAEIELEDALKPIEREIFVQEYTGNVISAKGIIRELGDKLEELFDGQYYEQSVECWKRCVAFLNEILPFLSNKKTYLEEIKYYEQAIKQYDSSYQLPEINLSDGACYVATAVYGSYDCPEVWTLRRFRDNTLDATWYGRTFIKTYYAISPTLVDWFGDTEWFKKMWRNPLDKMVASLQKKGVESTPYQDKY